MTQSPKIPTWEQAYNVTPEQYKQRDEQRRAQFHARLKEQAKPGYIPPTMSSWVISGLPKAHPVSRRMKYYDVNGIEYNASELYQQFLRGELT